MAYIPGQDENQQQQQGSSAAPGITSSNLSQGGTGSAGGGGAAGAGAGRAPQNQGQQAPTKSGRFTNINNYIQANKGYNQQGGGLAGQVYGNVQGQAQKVQQNLGEQQQQFQQQSQAARNQYNENLANQAVANPEQVTQNEENFSAFQRMRDAAYGGPQGLGNLGELQQQGQNLQSLANLGGSESGRYALLSKLYGHPGYNRGQQLLDNLLLQSNPDQLQKMQELNPLAQGLNQGIGQAGEQAGQQAQQYGQEAQQTQQKIQEALGGAIGGFNTQAQQELEQALAGRQKAFEGVQGQLAQGQLSAEDAAKFGLTGGQALYTLDPTQYLRQSTAQATKQNVISPEEYARINALGKLSGENVQGPASATLEEFLKNPNQAGEFSKQSAYDFDKARFLNDVAEKQGAYEQGKSFQQDIGSQLSDQGTTELGRLKDILASGTAGNIPNIATGRASINDINSFLQNMPQLQQRIGQLDFGSQSGNPLFNQQTHENLSAMLSRQVPALQNIINKYNQQAGIGRQLNVV